MCIQTESKDKLLGLLLQVIPIHLQKPYEAVNVRNDWQITRQKVREAVEDGKKV